jgi:hypothetical protein
MARWNGTVPWTDLGTNRERTNETGTKEARANDLFVPAAAWTTPYRCHDSHSNDKGTPHKAAMNSNSADPVKVFSGVV